MHAPEDQVNADINQALVEGAIAAKVMSGEPISPAQAEVLAEAERREQERPKRRIASLHPIIQEEMRNVHSEQRRAKKARIARQVRQHNNRRNRPARSRGKRH